MILRLQLSGEVAILQVLNTLLPGEREGGRERGREGGREGRAMTKPLFSDT